MYTVHCRVSVDNICEFQHSSSHVDCNFDARLVSKTRKYRSTKKLRKHVCQLTLVYTTQSVQAWSTAARPRRLVYNHHRAFMGSKVFVSFKLGVNQFTNFCVACCHCFASCKCCHDPFIVRSAQTRPPFTGFTQLAHPSRCSRSTLTTVCFCARASPRVSVFTLGLKTRHQIHHKLTSLHLVVELVHVSRSTACQ